MLRIQKILFPTDFSPASEPALRYALYLADKYGAALHMLHVVVLHADDPHNPSQRFPTTESVEEELRAMAERRLAGIGLASSPPTILQEERRGVSVAPVLAEYAEEEGIDLIVMGTHGRRGVQHVLLGSVTEETVRVAPCPVFAIPRSSKAPGSVDRIMVPVDFSEPSEEAVQVARAAATTYGASLQLVHVLENRIHPAFYNMGAMRLRDLQPDIDERAEAALRALYERLGGDADVKAETFALEGHAGRDIVRFAAEHDADVIVISSHGLSGLESLLMGGVAEKVVRRSPCPVLVLKPYERSLLRPA